MNDYQKQIEEAALAYSLDYRDEPESCHRVDFKAGSQFVLDNPPKYITDLVSTAKSLGCGRYGCGAAIGAAYTLPICLECKLNLSAALKAYEERE